MARLTGFIVLCLWASAATLPAYADDKSGYTIFNPTPDNLEREWQTDRPDKTESAYTIDAGHYSYEADIVNYTFDGEGGDRADSYLIMSPNLKVGVTNDIDLQLILAPINYSSDRSRSESSASHLSGAGDTTLRVKFNFWGNDGGDTALGLIPLIKFPTGRRGITNNYLEGGVILPYAIKLGEGLDLGMMSEVDVLHDSERDGYHGDVIHSATFGFDFTEEIGGYSELWTDLSPEHGIFVTADFGLSYKPVPNLQLDAGLNIGLTQQSDDLNPFIGISQRF